MNNFYIKIKEKLLKEKTITLSGAIGLIFIGAISTLTIVGFMWIYLYHPDEEARKLGDLIGFSLVWLFSEISLLIYLFKYKNIPNFVYFSILMLIASSNMWFILYLFQKLFP